MDAILNNVCLSSLFVLITQLLFMFFRTINIIHTTNGDIMRSALSNLATTIIALLGTSVGIKSVLEGEWTVVVFYLIGSTIGQILGMKKLR